jgi:hypothetical protein
MPGEPVKEAFRMLAEIVVSIETLIRLLNPQQLLLLSSQGIEDRLTN